VDDFDPETKCYNNIPLIPGNSYNIRGEFWEYEGRFDTVSDVPNKRCCYTVGNALYIKRRTENFSKPKERRKRADDEREIDTSIKEHDDTLMVLTKQSLRTKHITRGDFRKLFESTSDMNNMLHQIEIGDKLSWSRFTEMNEKLGLKYNVTVYEELRGKKQTIAGE
jgi:hypothetical protein